MCTVLFHVPQVSKRWGSKIFLLAPLEKLYPHLQNRGAALAQDRVNNVTYMQKRRYMSTSFKCGVLWSHAWLNNGYGYVWLSLSLCTTAHTQTALYISRPPVRRAPWYIPSTVQVTCSLRIQPVPATPSVTHTVSQSVRRVICRHQNRESQTRAGHAGDIHDMAR